MHRSFKITKVIIILIPSKLFYRNKFATFYKRELYYIYFCEKYIDMNFVYTPDTRIKGKYLYSGKLHQILHNYNLWKYQEGTSEEGQPIPLYRIGKGSKRILLWSQMHGNESTTTRALIDLFKLFATEGYPFANCQLYIIPMLNPDGSDL